MAAAAVLLLLITAVKNLNQHSDVLFRTWKSYEDVGVVVMVGSGNPEVLNFANEKGLQTSHIVNIEYHAYFQILYQYSWRVYDGKVGLLGYFNGDTAFDMQDFKITLAQVWEKYPFLFESGTQESLRNASSAGGPALMINGLRLNVLKCDEPNVAAISNDWFKKHCTVETFMQAAQDYFFFTQNVLAFLLEGTNMPNSRLGGIAFDNWLSARPLHWYKSKKRIQPFSIDASLTLPNYHLYHGDGSGIVSSHNSASSTFNRNIHRPGGGYDDYHCNEPAVTMYFTSHDKIQRRCPMNGQHGAPCYKETGCWWP